MTHGYDIMYRAMEMADVGNEFSVSRAYFNENNDEYDELMKRGFIEPQGYNGDLPDAYIFKITDKGLTAFDMPNAFWNDLDTAQYYNFGDEPENKYFRNDETGALANVNANNKTALDSVRKWREITEEVYLYYVNEAAAEAAERDATDEYPYPTEEDIDEYLERPVDTLPVPKESWLEHALAITTSDRRRDYGHPLPNFIRIALKWCVTVEHVITPLQVAQMMLDMKTARDQNSYKDDNWIDSIGYSNCVQMMDDRMKEMGYPAGVRTFQDKHVDNMVGFMYNLLRKHEAQYPQGS